MLELALFAIFVAGWVIPGIILWRLAVASGRRPYSYGVFAVLGWFGVIIAVLGTVFAPRGPDGSPRDSGSDGAGRR